MNTKQIANKRTRMSIVCMLISALFLTGSIPDTAHAARELHVAKYSTGDISRFSRIQAAINAAGEGSIVWVHPGTYTEHINFNGKNITVKSVDGFENTMIDGSRPQETAEDTKGVVTFQEGEERTAVLSGFTITNGTVSGIYCYSSGPTLENLKITGNAATSGAGIFCDNASPIIKNSVISGNTAQNRGGGIYCRKDAAPLLQNLEITDNTAYNGGGICCDSASPNLIHLTIADNTAIQGTGIFARDGSRIALENTIIWRDTVFFDPDDDDQRNTLAVSHSDIQGGQSGIINSQYVITKWSSENINADPLFADAENGDYRLSNLSPCIEKGIPGSLNTDIHGNPRPSAGSFYPDMGAYENQAQKLYVDATFTGTETGNPKSPFSTITRAIQAATPGSTIRVAQGTYIETLILDTIEDLKIEGGWNRDIWTRPSLPDPNATVIMALSSGAVVRMSHVSNVLMEGFTIIGDQVGISVEDSSVIDARSNIIRIDGTGELSGIHWKNSSGHIMKNIIHIVGVNPNTPSGYGITLKSVAGELFLKNNILYLQGNRTEGIHEIDADATPAALLHNEFYGAGNAILYRDANGRENIRNCSYLNNGTLNDIPEQGGNFCNLLSDYEVCTPPCADDVVIPTPEDTDGDEMPDNLEIHYFGDLLHDGSADTDSDGLTDLEEYANRTDPISADTDTDGMPDGWEISAGIHPLADDAGEDPDNDGYTNLQEYEGGTDPNDPALYPFLRDDAVTIDQGMSVNIPVLENDDGEGLTNLSATAPLNGTATVNSGGYVRYIPNTDFGGIDTFEYTARNSNGHIGSAVVTVYVRPILIREGSLMFDGADDYVIRNPVKNFPSEKITVEFWVKSSGTGYQALFSYTPEDSGNGLLIAVDEESVFQVHVGDKSVAGGSLGDDNWHHIAVTWQRADGKIKIFKDGYTVLSGTLAREDTLSESGIPVLGNTRECISGNGNTGKAFAGKMDDVRIWDYVRSQEEIQQDMNKHLTTQANQLSAYWRMDEGSGGTAFDYSDSGNHGQLGSARDSDENDPVFVTKSPLIPRTIYVSSLFFGDEETGERNAPYKSISRAIRVAPPESTIRVAKGAYNEALSIEHVDGLTIQGGWNSDGVWVRDYPADPNFTAIMAIDKPTALQISYAPNTVFEGFTIFGGGIGITAEHTPNVSIRNNIIHIPDSDAESSIGIHCTEISGDISENCFHLIGEVKPAYGIVLQTLADPLRIENNVLFMQGNSMTGILEIGREATPAALLNNEFYGDDHLILFQDGNGAESVHKCSGLNDDTLDDISERGGNFCNKLSLYTPCTPPCARMVAIPQPEDTDEDGMPDNWETYYFGDLSHDGTTDEDGDGRTDLQEYQEKAKPVVWNVKTIIHPRSATDAGAQWSADGGETWRDSGDTVSGSGEYILDFKAVDGWETPPRQMITPEEGQTITVIATYSLKNHTLTLSKEGCGGKVKINGELSELPWNGRFIWNESVSLEAVPEADCNFIYWTGDMIDTANPAELTMDGDKYVKAIFAETGAHFPRPRSTGTYMDMEGNIYDASVQSVAGGDEVAAFVSDGKGGLVTVGYSLYGNTGYFIRVYGDDPDTPEKDGAVTGEAVIFKTYNQSEDMEYTLRLIGGSNIWKEDAPRKSSQWRYKNIQRIPLHIGWNLFSFSVNKCYYVGTPPVCRMIEGIEYEEVESIREILSSIEGQYSYVRAFDCTGVKSYNMTPWSDMKYMAAGYGYEIKINEDAETDENGLIYLEAEGSRLSGKTVIPLHPGWNLTGYLGNRVRYIDTEPSVAYPEDTRFCPLSSGGIREAFCSIEGKYIFVKGFDKTGARTYNLTPWSNLKYVGPGYGYWIKVEDDEQPNLVWDSPCAPCEAE